MVMGDVDWFKHYNDRNGQEAGNRLLRELAAVLKSSIREDDLLCRYGGEEFLFFLAGVNNIEEATLLTERIRKTVEDHYFDYRGIPAPPQPDHELRRDDVSAASRSAGRSTKATLKNVAATKPTWPWPKPKASGNRRA